MKTLAIALFAALLVCQATPASAQWRHHYWGPGFGFAPYYGYGYGYGYGAPTWGPGYPGYYNGYYRHHCRTRHVFRHGRVFLRRYCY